jgi:hypothetical protein
MGSLNGTVRALALLPNGEVVAGGEFTANGGSTVLRLARWTGTAWAQLGAGCNDVVFALAVAIDGSLYAGGRFTAVGAQSASRMARWNGTTLTGLSLLGLNQDVLALAAHFIPNRGDVWRLLAERRLNAAQQAELAALDDAEQAEYLEAAGLDEPGLTKLIHAGYALLGLQSYFTVGPQEARAWTIPIGATAPQAAGVIHTDFEKGFIRAETIAFEDFVALRGEAKAREAGKLRAEGKSYVVKDGDVMNFLFN